MLTSAAAFAPVDEQRIPRADRRPVTTTRHGVTLTDDYAWLKAPNWQAVVDDPGVLGRAIRAYLEAENAYADAVFAETRALRDELFGEMKGRTEDDSTVPEPDGPYAYFHRSRQGGQYPLYCRTRDGGAEELLLDGDALAANKGYFDLDATQSPDHRLLVWTCDEVGAESYVARVRDLASGTDLADLVPGLWGSPVWTADSSAFYYVCLDEEGRPTRVRRHRVGTAADDDVPVYESSDPEYEVGITRLQSRRFAEISTNNAECAESWLLDLHIPDARPTLIAARDPSVLYEVEHHPSMAGVPQLFILTNADDAEEFKIMVAPLANPGRANWRELVPHRPGVYIESFVVFKDWLVRRELENGLPRLIARRLSDGEEHSIAFAELAEEAYSLEMSPGHEFESDTLRFNYSSMRTPIETWDYHLAERTRVLRKRQEVPSGHDPADYVTRRLLATAADHETVPISILHRRHFEPDGTAPAFVFGYGAYGEEIAADFNVRSLSLVDRGFVYAIAHVRGGTEKGRRWYRTGKLADKRNSFSDFIAVTEHLVEKGYCARGRAIASGGSAGGMLIGAVANARPDLYAGMIADVPFVDVLNTMLDEDLPNTPTAWAEWGDPIADAEAFHTILAYSPYENVRTQDYPAMLVLAGLTDTRVTYWEPAKWVARLRATNTGRSVLALWTNMKGGHRGPSGRFDQIEEVALFYAFAIAAAGPKT